MNRCVLPYLAVVASLVSLALPAAGQQIAEPKTTVLLTVSGNVAKTNLGPYDGSRDVYFKHLNIGFSKASAFNRAMLTALKQHAIRTDFPMGGKVRTFSGPRLVDVLAAAGATGTTATITAMDGYAAELPTADIKKSGVILALAENGKPFGVGDYGPAWVIFPRLDIPELKGRNDDGWVWSVVSIAVK